MHSKTVAVVVFVAAYVLLVRRKGHAPWIVWAGAALLLLSGVISPLQALHSINLNVIGTIVGTMVLSKLFIRSQVPAYLASKLVSCSRSMAAALLGVCGLAGAISAVVDNVATVLMIAPIAIEVSRCLGVSPVPLVIGVAVSANLEGAATLVGDSTSVLLASAANMSFADFFWMNGRPGIFFSVQMGALAGFGVLYWIFSRTYKGSSVSVTPVKVRSWVPTVLLTLMIVTMAGCSFIPNRPGWAVGATAIAYALVGSLWSATTGYDNTNLLRAIDWETVVFLAGLFVLIGSLTTTGLVADIADAISLWARGNRFSCYMIVVWGSVLVSAFVDNIPYTMAMLPVAQVAAANAEISPYVMMFGLLLGTTLGGNITPIGASANVVAVSLLRDNGFEVSFGQFARIGLPFTIAAALTGCLVNWMFWGC